VTAVDWLAPLAPHLPELTDADWARLADVEQALVDQLADQPVDTLTRSAWLLAVRRHLASLPGSPASRPVAAALRQTLTQVVCGWYDLDLRDATGPGHGAMILAGGEVSLRHAWGLRLACGDLVGIAATERHGGSRIQELTTQATLHRDRWLLTGEKCWVSRLVEAAAFVVFFRDPDGRISAGVVDAASPGLDREPIAPSGLGGWGWGILRLRDVPIDPARDVLGGGGHGLNLFRSHFTAFRPLVTATALGAAAGIHAHVAGLLGARVRLGVLPRIRDNALITLGRTHTQITTALLGTLATARLAALRHPYADLSARLGKAYGVDTAHHAVSELALLIGAAGFQAGHPVAKARADLTGLLYADGIHDSLYRSGGTSILTAQHPAEVLPTHQPAALPAAA
jgi:alkylation response protein AidB-like acyl-CoA dehydrogenase